MHLGLSIRHSEDFADAGPRDPVLKRRIDCVGHFALTSSSLPDGSNQDVFPNGHVRCLRRLEGIEAISKLLSALENLVVVPLHGYHSRNRRRAGIA